ncbi:hypothetical protein BGZ83_001480, partial [Gryganskiella cystojenkinii]
MESVDQPMFDQANRAFHNQNQYPSHAGSYHHSHQSQYPSMQQQHQPHQRQHDRHPYRGHRRIQTKNENADLLQYEEDDQDFDGEGEEEELDLEDRPLSRLHSSTYTSYNSETDDVNMDSGALKEEEFDLDHEMAEPPSSSSASSSSCSLTNIPNSTSATIQSSTATCPNTHSHHQTQPPVTPTSSSSSSSSVTPTSSSANIKHSTLPSAVSVAIKPRPVLRPLLPSRPTSPQPMIQPRPPSDLTDNNIIVGFSTSLSSSRATLLGSTNTSNSGDATIGTTTNAVSSSSNSHSGKTRQSAYKINGLNILNRNSLDSRTALEMIRRRRENHNHVERRRRDTLNSTILQIAEIIPNCSSSAKLNKGTILRLALEHLR